MGVNSKVLREVPSFLEELLFTSRTRILLSFLFQFVFAIRRVRILVKRGRNPN